MPTDVLLDAEAMFNVGVWVGCVEEGSWRAIEMRRSGSKRDGFVSVMCRVLVKDVALTVYDSWSFGCVQKKRCSWVLVVVPQQRHVGVDQKLQ